MKCPECSNNVKRGKEGMRCRCGYNFIFDPKGETRLTDGKFLALIRQASGNGTYYFTPNQLWNRYCRMIGMGCMTPLLIVSALWLIGLAIYFAVQDNTGERLLTWHAPLIFLSLPLGLLAIAASAGFFVAPKGGRRLFDSCLDRWQFVRPIEKLITTPSLHEPPPDWEESDIYDYGVECILVVDRDLYVDWLVLNGFFTQSRALILSVDGYPEYLVPRAQQILLNHPETPVFLLHDATPEGMAAETKLLRSGWLPLKDRAIIDLGLTPEDVKKLRRLRHLRPRDVQYQLPLDMIAYPMLAAGLTEALIHQAPLGHLIDEQASGRGGDSGGFG